jgi:superfamily II DNA or RNA helicase
MKITLKHELRDYQKKAVKQAIQYYHECGDIFRLNICVGGGKTTTSIHLATQLVKGQSKIVVVCHTEQLRDQFRENTKDQLGISDKDMASKFEFYTFHTLRNKTKKDLPNIGLLIIDEIHQGGQSDLGSYKKIIQNLKPKKILGLSATDAGVSESLFGKKTKKNTFTFSFSDAKKAGVLNECEIFTIHTGLEQHLEGLDKRLVQGEDLASVTKQDYDLGVNLSDQRTVDAINEANIYAAVETYFELEADFKNKKFPQAVFFVGTQAQADKCREIFLKRYSKHATKHKLKGLAGGDDIVRVTHSGMNKNDNIADFKNKKFPVLINVRQIQEGFDDPDLELVFDCAPSFHNEGRVFIQRIGRPLRVKVGKGVSRYYTFYKATGRLKKFNGEQIEEVLSEHVPGYKDASDTEKSFYLIHAENMVSATLAEHSCDTDKGLNEVLDREELEIDFGSFGKPVTFETDNLYKGSDLISSLAGEKPKSITVTRSDFIVTRARGHKIKNTVALHEFLQREGDAMTGATMDKILLAMKKIRGLA